MNGRSGKCGPRRPGSICRNLRPQARVHCMPCGPLVRGHQYYRLQMSPAHVLRSFGLVCFMVLQPALGYSDRPRPTPTPPRRCRSSSTGCRSSTAASCTTHARYGMVLLLFLLLLPVLAQYCAKVRYRPFWPKGPRVSGGGRHSGKQAAHTHAPAPAHECPHVHTHTHPYPRNHATATSQATSTSAP